MRLSEVAAEPADINQQIEMLKQRAEEIEGNIHQADSGAYGQDRMKLKRISDEIKSLKMSQQRQSGGLVSKQIAVDPERQPEINSALEDMWGEASPYKPWGFFDDGDGGVTFEVNDKKPGLRSKSQGATVEEIIDFVEQRYAR